MKKQKKQLIIMAIFLIFLVAAYLGLNTYNNAQEENSATEGAQTYTLTDLNYEDVVSFSYDYKEEKNNFTKSEDVWNYDSDESFDVEESTINAMLRVACTLTAQGYFDAYESLDNYGLDAPQITVSMSFADGIIVKILLGDYNDITEQYYLMLEGDSNLYVTDSRLLDAFGVSYTELETVVEETETISESTE